MVLRKLVKDVAIIGAGAAGMMCAIEAGKRGRTVILIDHAHKLAEKIRISGGGRCNFTNRNATAENYLSDNPDFCRSALARFTPQHFIALVEKHGIRYHEKKLGQLFCDNSAQDIIAMLQRECDAARVDWLMSAHIGRIAARPAAAGNQSDSRNYLIMFDDTCIEANALVIATGGLSIPQIGATPLGYQIANQFGIAVTSLHPGLVGLTFHADDFSELKTMSGISLDAEIHCNGAKFRENILFTHRGLSGPAILQISSYWKPGLPLTIDLFPQCNMLEIFAPHRQSNTMLPNFLARYLPKRFVQMWCSMLSSQSSLTIKPLRQYRDSELRAIAEQLHRWQVIPSGTMGYKKAEVTVGGIDTRELSSKTMEAKRMPGLYFIGEVVDVTGHLGGFNFQWAWSSGFAAGQAV